MDKNDERHLVKLKSEFKKKSKELYREVTGHYDTTSQELSDYEREHFDIVMD